jgi:gliding motility-associated-like protein
LVIFWLFFGYFFINDMNTTFHKLMIFASRLIFCNSILLQSILLFVVLSAKSTAQNINQGLVAHYKLDGNALDAGSFGLHGTNFGAVQDTDRFGRCGRALYFNGGVVSSDLWYIKVPHNALLNFTGPFSFSFWIKKEGGTNGHIISKGNIRSNSYFYEVNGGVGTTKDGLTINKPPSAKVSIEPLANLNGGWRHVVCIYGNDYMAVFVDGVQKGFEVFTPTLNFTTTNTNDLFIGRYEENGLPFRFSGSLDDIRIYNRALTLDDVFALYAERDIEVITSTPKSDTICSGSTVRLCAPDNMLSYQWVAPNFNSTEKCISVSPTTTTEYTLTLGVSNCSQTVKKTITVANGLVATITGNTNLCGANTTTLTASGGSNFLWSTGATTSSINVGVGTYTVTVSNVASSSCVGTASHTVSVGNPQATITGATTICTGSTTTLTASGGSSFLWNTGATTPSINVGAGSYTVTVSSGSGSSCSSTASQSVSIANTQAIISGATIICNSGTTLLTASGGSNFLWSTGATTPSINVGAGTYRVTVSSGNGTNCTSMATHTVATGNLTGFIIGVDSVCGSGTTSLTILATGATAYRWSTGETTATVNVGAGSYSVTASSTNGCSAVSSKTVRVANPSAAVSGNLNLCNATTTTLTASGGTLFRWSNGATSQSIVVGTGVFTVTVSNTGGCSAVASATVSANLPVVTFNPNLSVCLGSALTVTPSVSGANPFTYAWNDASTSASRLIQGTQLGTMTASVNVTDRNGCRGSATTTITVNPIPKAYAGLDDTITCFKPTITLTGAITANNSAAVATQWQRLSVGGGATVVSNSTIATVNQSANYVFISQNTTTTCSSRDTLTIAADILKPELQIQRIDSAKCSYSSNGKIIGVGSSGSPPLRYRLNGGIFRNIATFDSLVGGNYTVLVQGKNGCENSQNVVVPKPLPLDVKLSLARRFSMFYEGDVIPMLSSVSNARSALTYRWSATPSVRFTCQTCSNTNFSVEKNTALKLTVTDTYGCQTDTFMNFEVRKKFRPDVITPNGDGNNDILIIPHLENCGGPAECDKRYPQNEMVIINRWGNVVYQAKPYRNDWTGTNQNGQPLPQGTYFYTLRLNLNNGEILKGDILIVR